VSSPDFPRRTLKKGLGSFHRETTADALAGLGLAWYYNWRPVPRLPPIPGIEFVPMFWSAVDVNPENLAAVRNSPATHVLGFNEPDMAGQASMTPAECLDLWPRLESLPQRLGSPAPATASWLDEFLPEARKRGLRVDFICLHKYPDISNPDAPREIADMITSAHRKFGLPVWLTECGAADVAAWHQPELAKPTAAMARDFLRRLLPILEGLPCLERYAWFADRVGDEYRLGSIFSKRDGRPTPFGRIYRDWPPASSEIV